MSIPNMTEGILQLNQLSPNIVIADPTKNLIPGNWYGVWSSPINMSLVICKKIDSSQICRNWGWDTTNAWSNNDRSIMWVIEIFSR